ncbi:glycosylphosphatidylinositol anchor biosynthesis protein 11 [Paraphoma chrysanthemicola]|uniref:Glycosylphosphatidylinositol anchor biosynthesis protein 11 n=1 Tax=Paraphoma chrysanthemicola TaxID=798071 RepID=A0A8K0VWB4_9PLEO|nr:glycosylphosphatidylinositol anchor biosynthesis protein 11 [Paraphoma chrysanthemicola]
MSKVTIDASALKPKPTTATPISPLPNDIARTYTHIHPLIILSLYVYKFPSIVADPVPALTSILAPLAVLQIAFVALCLPPTGETPKVRKVKPGEKKRHVPGRVESGVNGSIVPAFLSLILAALAATPLLTATLVLFGAPATTHHLHTLLCGAHIALLSTVPLVYVHGVNGETWRQIVALLLPIDEVYGGLLGTFLGAWLGAIPIPLDWDREWQKWPVTIVTGAYIGYAVGKLLGGTLLKGKKIMFA